MPGRSPRRRFLGRALSAAAAAATLELPLAHGASLLAVRVWPAIDYTRVTLELDEPLQHSLLAVPDPPRLVVDLEGLEIDATLRNLVSRVQPDDPYIRQVRVGQYRPRTVRLVFDLKTEVAPQFFPLAPVAGYRHRLVLDLFPKAPVDPLAELIRERDTAGSPASGALPGPAVPPPARAPEPSANSGVSDRSGFRRLITVAIDPGHGGEDPGATGQGGTREKDVVLGIARLLRERLSRQEGMRAILTRDADFFVPLSVRVEKARRARADLFVSIHADAFVEPQARGASVFVLSERGASSSAARWLADRENRADLVGGVSLAQTNREVAQLLLDLSTTAQIRDSSRVGRMILTRLGGIGSLHRSEVERAGFAVLKAPDIPSILIETAFISNPDEERRLADVGYQQKVAQAIHEGILAYFLRHPPAPTLRMS